MGVPPNQLLAMTDAELQLWALSGDVGSYNHEIGQTAMNMRSSLRMAEASAQQAAAAQSLNKVTLALFAVAFVQAVLIVVQILVALKVIGR